MKLFLIFFSLFTSACLAQESTLYLKNDGTYIGQLKEDGTTEGNISHADFKRIIKLDPVTKLYTVTEVYTNGNNKRLGTSSTPQIPTFEGEVTTFYESGIKQTVSHYTKNQKSGKEINYYPNGKLYRIITFPDDGVAENEFNDKILINACYDSLGIAQVVDGNGHYTGFNKDFKKVTVTGNVKNAKKDGVWKGLEEGLNSTFTETYNDGQFISGESVNKAGKVFKYTSSRSVEPGFKGGDTAFGRYLSENIIYPVYARKKQIEGRVLLTFIIEKDGSINDVKVTKHVDNSIDNEAKRVVSESPKWLPGVMIGQPVRVIYSIPVNFALK